LDCDIQSGPRNEHSQISQSSTIQATNSYRKHESNAQQQHKCEYKICVAQDFTIYTPLLYTVSKV